MKKENENQTLDKKKIIGVLAIIVALALIIILLVIGNNKESKNNTNQVRVNNNEGVVKDKTVNGLSFTNNSITFKDGFSTISATVTNNTGSDYTKKELTILIKDKNGKEIAKMPAILNDVLPAGSSQPITSMIDIDLTKTAYTLEYIETGE